LEVTNYEFFLGICMTPYCSYLPDLSCHHLRTVIVAVHFHNIRQKNAVKDIVFIKKNTIEVLIKIMLKPIVSIIVC